MSEAAQVAEKPTIMVVDDEPLLREILVEDFQYEGFNVLEASGGKEAFEKLQSSTVPVQVVLSDIRMPEGSGVELLDRVQAEMEVKPKIVLISGFADLNESEALDKGAVAFFKKPFNNEDILSFVKSLVK